MMLTVAPPGPLRRPERGSRSLRAAPAFAALAPVALRPVLRLGGIGRDVEKFDAARLTGACSCPAWRNRSLPIERRTCKHLRKLRGNAAEEARVGETVSAVAKPEPKPTTPQLLLAETWPTDLDVTGWWLSGKLDGVRAYWDGRQFVSRQGNQFRAPAWFVADLPEVPLEANCGWGVSCSRKRSASSAVTMSRRPGATSRF